MRSLGKSNMFDEVDNGLGEYSPKLGTNSRVLAEVDLVLFDLKVMSKEEHLTFKGKKNSLILNKAHLLASSGCAVQPRMPLVPGMNDSTNNMTALASFLHSIDVPSIESMPYH